MSTPFGLSFSCPSDHKIWANEKFFEFSMACSEIEIYPHITGVGMFFLFVSI